MRKTISCLFLLLMSNSLAQALQFDPEQPPIDARMQSSDDWRVAFYDQGMRAVVLITSVGVETIPISDEIFARGPEEDEIFTTNLSPDGRYFLMTLTVWDDTPNPTFLIDLTMPESYTELAMPSPETNETFIGYNHWDRGAFSPDGREVALAYTSNDVTSGFGGIATIDLVSGQVTRQIDADSFAHLEDIFGYDTAWIGDWTESGIEFFPRCSACTPPFEFVYYLWHPDVSPFEQTTNFVSYFRGERLASTGELLYSHPHPDYPPGVYGWMFDPNNVVEVYQPNELPTEVRGQVVFYDLDFVDFTPAHWVMGGQAFIVKKGNQLVLISRGGLRFDFALASEQTFLGMTPNGWLMGDDVEGRIFHYHYTSDQFVIDEIADLQGPFRQMGGVNTASYGLLDFVKTIPVPDVVFCPGSMPSNLTVGNDAEVIVHNPEVAPFLQFMILDENGEWNGDFVALPLGATIHIVAGPHCDDPGPLYWTAEYDGMIGEIAEMYLTSYILRPLD